MKKLIWLGLVLLLATDTLAQRRGGFGGGFGRGGFGHGGFVRGGFGRGGFGHGKFHGSVTVSGFGFPHGFHAFRFGFPQQGFINLGIPPVAPIPPLGINAPFSAFDHRFGFPHRLFEPSGFFPSGFPFSAGGFDYEYPAAPNIIIVQQPASQIVVQEKPREVRPEIREYKQTTPTEAVPSEAERPAFVVALKDDSTHSAVAVWVQDDFLHYVDPEGRHRQVSLDQVDHDATRKLNRERKLNLWLPAPSGQ